jgi:hypothetical protein
MSLAELLDAFEAGRVTRLAAMRWLACRRYADFLNVLDVNDRRLPAANYVTCGDLRSEILFSGPFRRSSCIDANPIGRAGPAGGRSLCPIRPHRQQVPSVLVSRPRRRSPASATRPEPSTRTVAGSGAGSGASLVVILPLEPIS